MDEVSPSLLKYILFFSVLYSVALIITAIFQHNFEIDLGSGTSIGMLVGAGLGAAIKFVQETNRPPTKRERRLLSLGCVTASLTISVIALILTVGFMASTEEVSDLKDIFYKLSPLIWLLITVFLCLIDYLALIIIFGWGAKRLVPKLAVQ